MTRGFRFFLHLIVCLAVLGSMLLVMRAADSKPQIGDAKQIDALVKTLWSTVLAATPDDKRARQKRDWQMHLTTWLPDQWPPTTATVWTRYAYGLDVSMDGASDVSAPFARIEQHVGDPSHQVLTQMAKKLKVIAIHPVRPHGGWRYTLDDEKRVLTKALSLTSEPEAGARETSEMKSYYKSWLLGSAEIAALIESRHRAFFTWMKSAH